MPATPKAKTGKRPKAKPPFREGSKLHHALQQVHNLETHVDNLSELLATERKQTKELRIENIQLRTDYEEIRSRLEKLEGEATVQGLMATPIETDPAKQVQQLGKNTTRNPYTTEYGK
jgi:predicted nuclease with TOPRIM domain